MSNNIPCYAPMDSTTPPTPLAHESLVRAVRDALHPTLSSMVEHHTLMQSALTALREQQLVLADQPVTVPQHVYQKIEHLGFDMDRHPVAAEFAPFRVKFAGRESEDHPASPPYSPSGEARIKARTPPLGPAGDSALQTKSTVSSEKNQRSSRTATARSGTVIPSLNHAGDGHEPDRLFEWRF